MQPKTAAGAADLPSLLLNAPRVMNKATCWTASTKSVSSILSHLLYIALGAGMHYYSLDFKKRKSWQGN